MVKEVTFCCMRRSQEKKMEQIKSSKRFTLHRRQQVGPCFFPRLTHQMADCPNTGIEKQSVEYLLKSEERCSERQVKLLCRKD